jgi:hypothetical protein
MYVACMSTSQPYELQRILIQKPPTHDCKHVGGILVDTDVYALADGGEFPDATIGNGGA